MAGTSRPNPVLANPFYVGLMVTSTLFVVTALGYLVTPYVSQAGQAAQGQASRAFAAWLDAHGPLILAVEFMIMLLSGVLAMTTEDYFLRRKKPDNDVDRQADRGSDN
jgi:hypothetical protein